jgi:hypothetical protein
VSISDFLQRGCVPDPGSGAIYLPCFFHHPRRPLVAGPAGSSRPSSSPPDQHLCSRRRRCSGSFGAGPLPAILNPTFVEICCGTTQTATFPAYPHRFLPDLNQKCQNRTDCDRPDRTVSAVGKQKNWSPPARILLLANSKPRRLTCGFAMPMGTPPQYLLYPRVVPGIPLGGTRHTHLPYVSPAFPVTFEGFLSVG